MTDTTLWSVPLSREIRRTSAISGGDSLPAEFVPDVHRKLRGGAVRLLAAVFRQGSVPGRHAVYLRRENEVILRLVLPEPLLPLRQCPGIEVEGGNSVYHFVVVYFQQSRNVFHSCRSYRHNDTSFRYYFT